MTTELCIGTAQFGLNYGVTNSDGQVDKIEIQNILAAAVANDIWYLDSAQSYGEAESLLGSCKPKNFSFRIASKLSAQPNNLWGIERQDIWEKAFQKTLQNLQVSSIDSFFLHNADDLKHPNRSFLLDWLLGLQDRKLVRRIGVSIYSAADLKDLPLSLLQIVQLPLSIYDQRLLLNGTISKLSQAGIAIHARSVFLQGLILQSHLNWPLFLSQQLKHHHAACELESKANNLNMLDVALKFLRDVDQLEAVIVGVTKKNELAAIIKSWLALKSMLDVPPFYANWNWENHSDLDPRSWPSR